ncbi:MAG: hypothetical protein ACE5IY_21605 [bacterium]
MPLGDFGEASVKITAKVVVRRIPVDIRGRNQLAGLGGLDGDARAIGQLHPNFGIRFVLHYPADFTEQVLGFLLLKKGNF